MTAPSDSPRCHRTLGCIRDSDHGGSCDPRPTITPTVQDAVAWMRATYPQNAHAQEWAAEIARVFLGEPAPSDSPAAPSDCDDGTDADEPALRCVGADDGGTVYVRCVHGAYNMDGSCATCLAPNARPAPTAMDRIFGIAPELPDPCADCGLPRWIRPGERERIQAETVRAIVAHLRERAFVRGSRPKPRGAATLAFEADRLERDWRAIVRGSR